MNQDDPFNALKKRLKQLEPAKKAGEMDASERKILGIAARMGLEIVIALGVGLGIGYLIDKFFLTKPLFLILFALFGIAAGVLNVYRLVRGHEYRSGYKSEKDKKKDI